MKGYHFTILFAVLAAAVIMLSDINNTELNAAMQERHRLQEAFMAAVDAGAEKLVEADSEGAGLIMDKEEACEELFFTLFSAIGILDDPIMQDLIKLYVPVIAVMSEEGFYVQYNAVSYVSGNIDIIRHWSSLIPYVYEDDNFIYLFTMGDQVKLYDKNGLIGAPDEMIEVDYHDVQTNPAYVGVRMSDADNIMLDDEAFLLKKREVIISKIEEYLTYYVNLNNNIAGHYGIAYEFFLPAVDDSEWIRSIDGIGIMAVFQGYPYNNGKNYYNQFAVAGAVINRADALYIVKEGTYYIYHSEGCSLMADGKERRTRYSVEDCAKEGAYACQSCHPEGVHK